MNKIKLFNEQESNRPPEIKSEIKSTKTMDIGRVKMMEQPKSESADKNKLKERKMSKALARIKKAQSISVKHDLNDVRFKSIRIKNMAELLENQLGKANMPENTSGDNVPLSDRNREDAPSRKEENEQMMDKMFEINRKHTLIKRKKTKKTFEDI